MSGISRHLTIYEPANKPVFVDINVPDNKDTLQLDESELVCFTQDAMLDIIDYCDYNLRQLNQCNTQAEIYTKFAK